MDDLMEFLMGADGGCKSSDQAKQVTVDISKFLRL